MRHLTHGGFTFAYVDVGRGAPPIVLVHDRSAVPVSLAPQIARFRRSHRVVAVDLPRRVQDSDQGQDESDLADGLARVLYELGVYLPVVVGHGSGSQVALDLSERYPELVAGVVAVGSARPDPEPAERRHRAPAGKAVPRLDLSEPEPADRLCEAVEAFSEAVRPGAGRATD